MTIKNGDLPAMPIEHNGWGEPCNGLTKREQFAVAALQGILSCDNSEEPNVAAFLAVAHADALLAQLELNK